ncbi:MAG: translation elongation factor Ts [Planctomycetota bacterium]
MTTGETTFTAKDVMALRKKTGLGMLDCKKALTEAGGDPAAAEEWLREKLKGKMETRTERATGEGRIGIKIDGDQAVIIEVQTETDFTARNENFVNGVEQITALAMTMPDGEIAASDEMTKIVDDLRITTGENANYSRGLKMSGGSFGSYLHHDGKTAAVVQIDGGSVDAETLKGMCQHIVFHNPMGISEDDVPADKIAQIRANAIQEAKDTGKPEEIATKIAEGKVRKHLEENTLMHQKYVLDESKQIKELLPNGATIKSFIRFQLGG